MVKSNKRKAANERRKYCHCTPTCTSKVNRKTRLQHYRRANIPFNRAPRSVTATKSDEEGPEEKIPLPSVVCHGSERNIDDGYLGSGSEYEGDQMDSLEQEEVNNSDELGQEYNELRMNIDEEFVGGTEMEDSNSEREDLNDQDSEFDEWKEFDEEAEADLLENLSDSDRLSELDLMLDSDDLGADAHEAEGWANRLYSFRIQRTQGNFFKIIRQTNSN